MKIQNAYLASLNMLALVFTLTVNALANILPINGMNTGEVSAIYPSLFTPAGLTFSIWSVIYLLLVAFCFYQFTRVLQPYYRMLSFLFIGSCVLNGAWIVAWHYLMPNLSVVIMVALLLTLLRIFLLLQHAHLVSSGERWLVRLPFTIYLAWICVATIANISAALARQADLVNAVNPTVVTLVMQAVAAGLAVFMTWRFGAPAFALVVMWALYGIHVRWRASDFNLVADGALLLVGGLAIVTGIVAWRVARKPVAG